MDPKFQTSFIPKKSVLGTGTGTTTEQTPSGGINFFSAAAGVVFVLTILVSIGLHFYNNTLRGQIVTAQQQISDAEASFQPDVIQEIISADARIKIAKNLLSRHIVNSVFLEKLNDLIIKRGKIDQLSLINKNNKPSVSIEGGTASYNALSEESRYFAESSILSNSEFTDFGLSNTGMITFKFNANISPEIVSYSNFLKTVSTSTLPVQ